MSRRRKNAQFARKYVPNTIDDIFAEFGVIDDATQAQANRRLVDAFYERLNDLYPGNTVVYIPPPEAIRPKLSVAQQVFVLADYAVRKIAPIVLDAIGLNAEATKLRKLAKIVNYDTADIARLASDIARLAAVAAYDAANAADAADAVAFAAGRRAYSAGNAVADATSAAYVALNYASNATVAANVVANAANDAAKLNPEATWDAVTEMLYAL